MMNRSIHILVPPQPHPTISYTIYLQHTPGHWLMPHLLLSYHATFVLPAHGYWLIPHLLSYLFMVTGWYHTCCLTCSWSLADTTPAPVLPVHGHWLIPHLLSYLFMVTGWCHTHCCLTCSWSLADATPTAVLPVHTGWCHTCCSLTFATVVGLLAKTEARSCNINTQAADASTLANKNIQYLTLNS